MRGKVEHPLGSDSLNNADEGFPVLKVHCVQVNVSADRFNSPGGVTRTHQQVERMSVPQESPGEVRADKSGRPTKDHTFHGLQEALVVKVLEVVTGVCSDCFAFL